MKNKVSIVKLMLFLFICLFVCKNDVFAVTYAKYSTGSYGYTYDHSNGSNVKKVTSGANDWVKLLDGKEAYCVQFKSSIKKSDYYKVDTNWKESSEKAITSGKIIDLVNNKYKDDVEAYGMTAITLNAYFAKELGNTKSRGYCLSNCSRDGNWYKNNSNIKKFIDDAKDYYKKVVTSTSIPKPKFSGATVMNLISGDVFISNRLTLSDLKKTYGGEEVKYTLTLKVTGSGSAQFCSNANGSGCQNSVSISGKESYAFYVKGSGVNKDTKIQINVSAKNSSKYLSSIRYINDKSKADQPLLVPKEFTVERKNSSNLILTVPDTTQYGITVYKINEDGITIDGANLELRKDTPTGELLTTNNGQSSALYYSTPRVETGDVDFFKHNYWLIEKNSPSGYVLLDEPVKIHDAADADKMLAGGSTSYCYRSEDGATEEVADKERCNFDAYKYMCQTQEGELVSLDDEACQEKEPDPDETGGEGTEGTDPGDSTGGLHPSTVVSSGKKVCVKNGKDIMEGDNETYCSEQDKYIKVIASNGYIAITKLNEKNTVRISKRAITGDEEVTGAYLKVCTKASYDTKKNECEAAKTIDDIEMSWYSGSSPYEISGLVPGDYYIVEDVPPAGYIKATQATPFTIDNYGKVTTGTTTITHDQFKDGSVIVINNKLNNVTISKTDIATSKELPGATLSICLTYEDEDGKIKLHEENEFGGCSPVTLADGTDAVWKSSDKPKNIVGLPAGTYYLMEIDAPSGYSTAESVLFTMKDDGTLVDKDGKLLKDNKLVMNDEKIKEVKTGMFTIYVILAITIVVVGLGIGSYYYLGKNNGNGLNGKIRKRKIHKMNV